MRLAIKVRESWLNNKTLNTTDIRIKILSLVTRMQFWQKISELLRIKTQKNHKLTVQGKTSSSYHLMMSVVHIID